MKINIKDYINNIPTELKSKNQKIWGLWDLEERDGRTTKVPYNAMTNKRAKSNDKSTWCDFEQAIYGLKKYKRKGLAIFLGGGLCGLDVDHVDAELSKFEAKPNSNNLVKRLKKLTNNSYMEVSQSGAGIHVLFRGSLSKNVNNHPNNKPFELYDHGRFFALTGSLITNKPEYKLLDGEQVIDLVNATVGFKEQRAATFKAGNNDLSVDEIISKIYASSQGAKFKHLMEGNMDGYSNQSSADIALCNILAFWTNKDPLKMDTIFRQSMLYRPKWDKKHRGDGATYGQMTIERAIEDTNNGYNMDQQRNNDTNLQSLAETINNTGGSGNIIPIDGTSAKQPQEDISWRQGLIYNKTKIGDEPTLKSTAITNPVLILKNDPNFKGVFKYNDFIQCAEVDKNTEIKIKDTGTIKFPKGRIQDIDATNFALYCEKKYNVSFQPKLILAAIDASAHQNSYNPMVDYMEKAQKSWDGKKRLDKLFPVFLGAEDNETTKFITHLWFRAGVARIYEPGIEFHESLDLIGGQGTGKTTMLRRLAPLGKYTDHFNSWTKKDDLMIINEAFILNDDEMVTTNHAGFDQTKRFISDPRMVYRDPYALTVKDHPAHFIVARTTNQKIYLRDRTGNRRFLTILVDPKQQQKKPYEDLTDDLVLKLWGEAVDEYKKMKKQGQDPLAIDQYHNDLLEANRSMFKQTSALQDAVEDTIDLSFADRDFISRAELAYAMYHDESYFTRAGNGETLKDITKIMDSLGYVPKKKRIKQPNGNTKQVRGFDYIGK